MTFELPPALPTQLQDPWFSERQAWDEWAENLLTRLPRGLIRLSAVGTTVESTATGTPSPWSATEAVAIEAGRRYRLTFDATFADTSATNNAGTGVNAEWQSTGALVQGATSWGRAFVAGRFDANRIRQQASVNFTAATTGIATISMRITRLSADGRATLQAPRWWIDDVGPLTQLGSEAVLSMPEFTPTPPEDEEPTL
jgi:hypothetical protein